MLKLIRRGTAVARVSAGTTNWVAFDNPIGLTLSAGTYLVTICTQDVELENVYTWDNVNAFSGVFTMQPGVARVVTMKRDGMLRIRNVTSERGGLVVVKAEPIPPPCVIAFWRVWGWRCGVKEDQYHAARHRGWLLRDPKRQHRAGGDNKLVGRNHHPALGTGVSGSRNPFPDWQWQPRTVYCRAGRHAKSARYERHRQSFRADHLPHLTPAGGEGRGA